MDTLWQLTSFEGFVEKLLIANEVSRSLVPAERCESEMVADFGSGLTLFDNCIFLYARHIHFDAPLRRELVYW